MAEQSSRSAQYSYAANANLVLQTDRSSLPRRDLEPSGEAESLWGKIDPRKMGDRSRIVNQQSQKRKIKVETSTLKKLKTDDFYSSVLDATDDFEGLVYRPKTKETKATYELILAFLAKYLGDVPQDMLRSATDSVIEILKQTEIKDFDKKTEVQDILTAQISSEQFAILTNLGKKINDFGDAERVQVDNEGRDVDEDYGVAVVFDDESEDEEDFEIKDAELEDEGEEADATTTLRAGAASYGQEEDQQEDAIDEFTTILAAAAPNSKKDVKVDPKTIDAFWHQRLISMHFPDAYTAQAKASAVMEILASPVNARDAENELMALFDYEKFDLVKVLTVNRDAIVWCTKLAKAGTPEEIVKIENEMKDHDLEFILNELKGTRETVEEPTPMDIDEEMEAVATAMPKQTVNLEALVFNQGSHLMTNKKVKLPEGSYKRSKKGYEEVHVPPPQAKIVKDEIQIKITDMPEWAQTAFPGAKTLNRIQSKVYNIAFNEDDNMLLCAPTGAGK